MPDPFTDEDRARVEWWPNQARVEIREWPKDGTIPLRYGAYISAAYKDQVAVLRRASDPYWVRIFIRDWQVKAERYEKALEREAQRRVAAEIESEMARAALKGENDA